MTNTSWPPGPIPEPEHPITLSDADDAPAWEPWPPPSEEPARTERRRRPAWVAVVAMVLGAAFIGAVVGGAFVMFDRDRRDEAAPPAVTVIERVETRFIEPVEPAVVPPAESVADVVGRVVPSIVTVEQGSTDDDGLFFRAGGGSGVVIDTAGHIVTNHHVIEDAEAVRVVFADGRIVSATIIGSDPLTDVGVLRISLDDLTPIGFGSTEVMHVGATAYAVGNPLIMDGGPSVTAGVISALGRRVRLEGAELYGMIQTDAPITRGSSGGALVDSEGRLIGITTAFGVSDHGQEGLSFAIPVEIVQRVSAELIATGTISHAFLGIVGGTHYVDSTDGSSAPAGVIVIEVSEGTAAAEAGLVEGDVIVSWNSEPVLTIEELIFRLRLDRVGTSVEIGFERDGELSHVGVRLVERPEGV